MDEEDRSKLTHHVNSHCSVELGWIVGVLIPNLFGICGAILFLRFIWIVTEVGLGNYSIFLHFTFLQIAKY